MPTTTAAYATLRGRWRTQMEEGGPKIPTQYDNIPFGDDFDGTATPKQQPDDAEWAQLTLLRGTRAQITAGAIGTRTYREEGLLVAQLFAPKDKGTKNLEDVEDTIIRTAFVPQVLSSVRIGTPESTLVGEQGGLWQLNVSIPYEFDYVA